MNVTRAESAPRRMLGGEVRTDYLGDFFKLVVTEIPPRHEQRLHHHDVLYDIAYVVAGQVIAVGTVDGGTTEVSLAAGDLVEFRPPGPHTVRNDSNQLATMLTLKIAAPSVNREDFSRLLADDWVGDEDCVD